MTVKKIEGACVYKGHGYTDGSHPDDGSLVLLNNGEAFFGGAAYRREGYPLPEEEPSSRFSVGDRVLLSGRTHAFDGQLGTVHEDTLGDPHKPYTVAVVPDSVTDGFPVWFRDSEVSPAPTPPPVTHRHPEGLYADPYKPDYKVYVQHEDTSESYKITYVSDETRDGAPPVNKGMSASAVSFYNLVTAA